MDVTLTEWRVTKPKFNVDPPRGDIAVYSHDGEWLLIEFVPMND